MAPAPALEALWLLLRLRIIKCPWQFRLPICVKYAKYSSTSTASLLNPVCPALCRAPQLQHTTQRLLPTYATSDIYNSPTCTASDIYSSPTCTTSDI